MRDYLGFGLGLRPEHYSSILETTPAPIEWLEIITENYLVSGGKPLYFLDKINEKYPLVMHGVAMALGNTDPLNWDYLHKVKQLSQRINPAWISDHLCWTGIDQKNSHDLLPLPYTEEAATHLIERIKLVQDFLEKPFLIENVSSYIEYHQSSMTEWDFLNTICEESNCLLLLDVNNVYVSGFNHDFDPTIYIDAIASKHIQQIHLAGHSHHDSHIIDTHDHPVADPVWQLYAHTISRHGQISTMIERDDNIPPLADVLEELMMAKQIATATIERKCS